MAHKHIVKSYDDALELFRSRLVEMGREALDQIIKATQALLNRDDCLAEVVMVIDEIEHGKNLYRWESSFNLITQPQPHASKSHQPPSDTQTTWPTCTIFMALVTPSKLS